MFNRKLKKRIENIEDFIETERIKQLKEENSELKLKLEYYIQQATSLQFKYTYIQNKLKVLEEKEGEQDE